MTCKETTLQDLVKSGNIWGNPWWLKEQWRKYFTLSDEEYLGYFELLKKEFDEKWVKGLDGDVGCHPLIRNIFFGEGVFQIQNLLSLAENLICLKGVHGFNRVIKDYRTIKQARNAELEMFMARVFANDGCDVEYIIPKSKKGKTPDFIVRKEDAEFVVECKFLDNAKGEKWIRDYGSLFGATLNELVPSCYSLFYFSYNPEINIWDYGYHDSLTSVELAVSIDTLSIREKITEIIESLAVPAYVPIPGKGDLMMLPYSEQLRGQISLPELSTKFFIRRLLSNGIRSANEQISTYGIPGIAAIFYSGVAHINVIQHHFDEMIASDPVKYELLMGVIIFPEQNILHYVHPYWITNKLSKFSAYDHGVLDTIDKAFEPIR